MTGRKRLLLPALALVLVSILTINFAVRGFQHARRMRNVTNEPIQAWMNVPYIAHAYGVHPKMILQALGLPLEQRDRRPLRLIAAAQNKSVDELIATIMAAIDHAPATPPGPPRPPRRPPPPVQPTPPLATPSEQR